MNKMDKLDRKILYALDKNARSSFIRVGKEVRLASETVRYRMQQIVKKGIISHFTTILNPALLDYSYYEIYFKLRKIDQVKMDKLLLFLKSHEKVCWIAQFEGTFDFGIIIIIRNQLELKTFFDALLDQFGPIIMKKTISVNLKGEFLSRDYLVDKKRIYNREKVYEKKGESIEIDETDAAICKALASDARLSCVDISQKLKVSPDTVLIRLKKLMKNGLISGHTIILNNEAMQQFHYKILLYLQDMSAQNKQKIIAYVKTNNRVIAIIQTLSEWDLEIDLEVDSPNQLREFTMQLTNAFGETIKDYETLRVLSMPKYNFFP